MYRSRLCVPLLFLALVVTSGLSAKTYYADGYHGGYFLADERSTHLTLEHLFTLLDANPGYKVSLEIEPYTIDRMLNGGGFDCERKPSELMTSDGWTSSGGGSAANDRKAGRSGSGVRLTLPASEYENYCQPVPAVPLRGHTLTLSAWVRQNKGSQAQIYCDAFDMAGFIPGSDRLSVARPADGRWQRVTMSYPVPANAVTLMPQIKVVSAPAEADFDDVSLLDTQTGREILSNGSFERAGSRDLRDPAILKRLRGYVSQGRIEVVGGTYTQPLLFGIDGESVVRQFTIGNAALLAGIGARSTVYAAQEPCWCGQLPQLLNGLGYGAALYHTSWNAFGAAPLRDIQAASWVGPDGSAIETVPQYTQVPNADFPAPAFVHAATRAGIENPFYLRLNDLVTGSMPVPGGDLLSGKSGSGFANISASLDAEGLRGKDLRLSAWVRSSDAGAQMYIDAYNAKGAASSAAQSGASTPDGAWRRLEVNFSVPSDAVVAYPQVRVIGQSGNADVCGLELVEKVGQHPVASLGRLDGSSIPGPWGVGGSEDSVVTSEVRHGGQPSGDGYVHFEVKVRPIPVSLCTPSEYLRTIGSPSTKWVDAYADFRQRYPFGYLGGEVQLDDRLAVDAVLRTERACSILGADRQKELTDIWKLTMVGEHHDAWVCAPFIFGIWNQYKSYADLSKAVSAEAQRRCDRILDSLGIVQNLGGMIPGLGMLQGRSVQVINTGAGPSVQPIDIDCSLRPGVVKTPAFYGPDGRPASGTVRVLSRHPDGSANQVRAILVARVDPMSATTYRLADGTPAPLKRVGARARAGSATLSNGYLCATVSRDGLLSVTDSGGVPLLGGPISIAGLFSRPEVGVVEKVNVRWNDLAGTVTATGRISATPFTATVTLSPYSRMLRIGLDFDFGSGTDIGSASSEKGIPCWAQHGDKLRLVVPLVFRDPSFLTHGPFEIRRFDDGRQVATRMCLAEGDGRGVALFTDRTSAVVCRRDAPSVEVALAYGGRFMYAPNEHSPLIGRHHYNLALAFYKGGYEGSGIPQMMDEFSQPLLVSAKASLGRTNLPVVRITPSNRVLLTAAFPMGSDRAFRVWNPGRQPARVKITIRGARSIWSADLGGKRLRKLSSGASCDLTLGKQQIMTLVTPGR